MKGKLSRYVGFKYDFVTKVIECTLCGLTTQDLRDFYMHHCPSRVDPLPGVRGYLPSKVNVPNSTTTVPKPAPRPAPKPAPRPSSVGVVKKVPPKPGRK